ncbi:MAG: hypothetical protein EAZ07_10285 [Cytophagales bacterium]|nr:MAG: hypothetical protein EAZ07_10285 [Cytophagales bacterium]
MKNIFWIPLLLLCFVLKTNAQKINVIEENSTIDNKYAQGFSVVIDLDKSEVKKDWSRQLKSYGSLTKDGSKTTIYQANVPSLPTAGSNLYSQTSESPNGLKIWLCIITPDKLNSSDKIISENQAKSILKDFAATSYRDNINEQIKDAEKVLMSANKNQERTFKNNEKIKNQILDNATEKIDLENKLKKNASDLIQFNKDLEQNKKDQEKAKKEVEEMKKVVDIVKSKLNEIN